MTMIDAASNSSPRQAPAGDRSDAVVKLWMIEIEHPLVNGKAISLHHTRERAVKKVEDLTNAIPDIQTTVTEVSWQPHIDALLKYYGDQIADQELTRSASGPEL